MAAQESKKRQSKHGLRRIIVPAAVFVFANILNLCRLVIEWTCRFEKVGEDFRLKARSHNPGGGYLLACWHETVLTVAIAQRSLEFCALCSRSDAGRGVAFLMKRMGFHPIMGSRSSGGKAAREEILDYLGKGVPSAITVDGSSGPRRFVKAGIVNLAQTGKVAILPVYTHSKNPWVLNTWDRFRIPKPFSTVRVCYGEPITVPAELEEGRFEEFQEKVKKSLDEMESKSLT